jgi:hypothetical protein
MNSRPALQEIKDRIQSEVDQFGGNLPERVALVWDGYLAALLEWDLITPSEHKDLSDMLPEIPDNPVMAVFLGRDSGKAATGADRPPALKTRN